MFGYLTQPPSDYLVRYEEVGEEEAQALTARSGRKGGRGKVMPREIWLFPHNIQFEAGDWVTKDIYDDTKGYDLILACVPAKAIRFGSCALQPLRFQVDPPQSRRRGPDRLLHQGLRVPASGRPLYP
jgi:hypothetical protein